MSGTLEIDIRFTPSGEGVDPARFEALLETVADELANLGVEPDYTAVVADLKATWAIEVPDASEKSLIDALTKLQTALQAAGFPVPPGPPPAHEVVATRHLALT